MSLQSNIKEIVSMTNGSTAVLLPNYYTKTVSIGILVGAGSITESKETLGYSHFIEHMVFKGTSLYSYEEISIFFETMGAYINAYTNKYYTVYYVHLLKEFADKALQMLLHMITESSFNEGEIKKEREVILEEMVSYQDTPDDFAIEQFYAYTFPDSYMGQPIIGTKETLNKATKKSLLDYYEKYYSPSNMIISIAGNIDPLHMKDLISNYPFKNDANDMKPYFRSNSFEYKKGVEQKTKDIEQTHVALGFPMDPYCNEQKASYRIFNMLLGELTSSRLYLTIREKMALCYHIESQLVQDPAQGLIFIYGSTKPTQSEKLIHAILGEIKNLEQNPFTEKELEMAKNQLKTQWVFKKENISSLMIKNAVDIYFKRNIKEKEFLKQIEDVSIDELKTLSTKLINSVGHLSLFALTPNSFKEKIKITL